MFLLQVFNLGNLHGEGSGEDDVLVLHLVVVLEQPGGKHGEVLQGHPSQ